MKKEDIIEILFYYHLTYEQAQKYLIDHNIIDKSECHR